MEKKINSQEENKKRNAFKRFSQIGVAGLAVMSLSAFANEAKIELSAKIDNSILQQQQKSIIDDNLLNIKPMTNTELAYTNTCCADYSNYGNHKNYGNDYSNYSNYSNCKTE